MRSVGLTFIVVLTLGLTASAQEPLHQLIDKLILAKAGKQPVPALADDYEFVRRVYLDLAGRIPSVAETRAFVQDKGTDKRVKLVDKLLAGSEYNRAMTDAFDIALMERLGDNAEWSAWLRTAFEKNKPWDQMVREMLRGTGEGDAKGAPYFLSKRLENYGQNPVDYPALTRDIGRLFLGIDLRCAQCHDHIFVKDYKQRDFQGLFAFIENVALANGTVPSVNEKPTVKKSGFQSVFKKIPLETGPRVPGLKENEVPVFKKGEEFSKPPDPKTKTGGELKFSTLALLSTQLPVPENNLFNRNIANRVWHLLMGRGLVHPLDMHHSDNPPSHPEVLDLLAKELVTHKYDLKWLIRELALTQTYQRTSIVAPNTKAPAPETFLLGLEKRLSAEQLMWSMLEATGERERFLTGVKPGDTAKTAPLPALRAKFLKAFADPMREPEEGFSPSLKAVLFLQHDAVVVEWLNPKAGNLLERIGKLSDDKVAEELYVSVLSRLPAEDEKKEVADYLKKNANRRPVALGHLAWALLSSTEFCLNH